MKTTGREYDPWGPISTILYEIKDSDLVLNAINNTGIIVHWHPLTPAENVSNSTRIRAFRQDISYAYSDLDDDQKGQFAQIVVKAILSRFDGNELGVKLLDRLRDIGWTITKGGLLQTEDALIREQFFPPNSEYDAYLTIREVFEKASKSILVEDPYIGTMLLSTLRGLSGRALVANILTVERNLPKDFEVELGVFRKQVSNIRIEVRATNGFHDRFIVIDDDEFYLVGASIKDAGRRAFVISRIEDRSNISNLREMIRQSWDRGTPLL